MRCEYLLGEDKFEFTLNFSSSSANDPGDDPVSELEVSDWDVRRARVGEGDDNFRSSLLTFLLVSLPVELVAGNDFLRFFELRLIISFNPLLDECLFLVEVQLNGEHVIFISAWSSKADELYRGLLDGDADKWRDGGTVSPDEVRSTPSLEVATIKYMLHINHTSFLCQLLRWLEGTFYPFFNWKAFAVKFSLTWLCCHAINPSIN